MIVGPVVELNRAWSLECILGEHILYLERQHTTSVFFLCLSAPVREKRKKCLKESGVWSGGGGGGTRVTDQLSVTIPDSDAVLT
ncbi:hypothetical protein TNCV_2209211 [Trichonephila clavipes]|nr:hypothetical protein TNCV_2209211 [Trichonephila clavipes]